jgi:hypothetical protein
VNSTAQTLSSATGSPRRAILWGGLISGALDITAAFVVYGYFGARPVTLLQGIAAGLLGSASFEGGLATAALGLFLQFFIATSATAVYYAVSRWMPFLVEHPLIAGPIYGIAVYFFMNRVVVPLSRAHKFPFSWRGMIIGLVIHILCVGTPIALAVRRFSR